MKRIVGIVLLYLVFLAPSGCEYVAPSGGAGYELSFVLCTFGTLHFAVKMINS